MGIPDDGVAGVQLGDFDITPIAYKNDPHGHAVFSNHGWQKFHESEDDLKVGLAVLITGRKTTKEMLDVKFVFRDHIECSCGWELLRLTSTT